MTGYESKKAAAQAKTIDQVNWADHEPDGLVHTAQEPVATLFGTLPIYDTAPPQRPWVGMTEEETSGFTQHEMAVVKYVSKVLQEKNT